MTQGFVTLGLGIFRKCVTLGFSKNWLYRVGFEGVLCMTMDFCAIKLSIFSKMDEILRKTRKFQKILAPAAPKMCHLNNFSAPAAPKKPHFRRLRRRKCVTLEQK